MSKTVTLSTGVTLKVKYVNPFIITEATRSLAAQPEPPVQTITGRDGKVRQEQNLEHPAYKLAIQRYQIDVVRAMEDVLISLGTETDSTPEGFSRAADDDWADILAGAGIEIATEGRKRYVAWVKFWAISTPEDLETLTAAIRDANATPEGAVDKAATAFRSP